MPLVATVSDWMRPKKDRRNVVPIFCCMEGLGCSLNTAHFSLLWQTNHARHVRRIHVLRILVPMGPEFLERLYCGTFQAILGTSVNFWMIILSSSFIFPCHPQIIKIDSTQDLFSGFTSHVLRKFLHRIDPQISMNLPVLTTLKPPAAIL